MKHKDVEEMKPKGVENANFKMYFAECNLLVSLRLVCFFEQQMLGSGRVAGRTSNQGSQPSPIIVPAQPVASSVPNQAALNSSSKSYISPILDHSGSRKRHEMDSEQDYTPE